MIGNNSMWVNPRSFTYGISSSGQFPVAEMTTIVVPLPRSQVNLVDRDCAVIPITGFIPAPTPERVFPAIGTTVVDDGCVTGRLFGEDAERVSLRWQRFAPRPLYGELV